MKKSVTRKFAIEAVCHECLGYYADGKQDCENPTCPLYTYMPYRKKEPDLAWTEYNPRSKGLVTWDQTTREVDAATKERLKDNLEKARKKLTKEKKSDKNKSTDSDFLEI